MISQSTDSLPDSCSPRLPNERRAQSLKVSLPAPTGSALEGSCSQGLEPSAEPGALIWAWAS